MSAYTPTTEQIRTEWALSNPGGSPTTIMHAEAAFDRWLAAHDAEVRAAALTEQGTEEWEYGTALRTPTGEIWDHEPSASLAEAQEHHRLCLKTPDDYAPDECIVVKRALGRPAGPWVPVDQPASTPGVETRTPNRPNRSQGDER